MSTVSVLPESSGERERHLVLVGVLALFLLRVVGQVEARLIEPLWLPPMSAWYSGWLPYPILLPAQILLLMLMAVMVFPRGGIRAHSPHARRNLRVAAVFYFVVMLVRAGWISLTSGADAWERGLIPVAFHWVLALFLLVWAREPSRP